MKPLPGNAAELAKRFKGLSDDTIQQGELAFVQKMKVYMFECPDCKQNFIRKVKYHPGEKLPEVA